MKNLGASPERSIVTVLVVDTVNSTGHIAGVDPDDAQELLDRIFEHLNGAVEQAGGLLVNFHGDGGVAIFGWPNSLEDHADRACDCAWLVQEPSATAMPLRNVDGRPVRFRVGIHTGLVGLRRLTMDGGNRLDIVGGTVHLAAALQKQAAPDTILVSSKTLELCRAELELVPHGDVPILTTINASAYRLCARPRRPTARHALRGYRLPLVGRLDEREVLRNALATPGSKNRTVAVIGVPGIGKSRLTADAIREAQTRGISVLAFYGDSQKRTTPYAAMRALILETLSLSEASADDDVIAALKTAGIDDLRTNPLTTVLLARHIEARGTSNQLTLVQVARALIETLERLTRGKPTLIVIEDLHLLDLESIQCLRLLAEDRARGSRTLLVTGRPEAMSDAQHITETILRLDPLPRQEMRELAEQLWPGATPPLAIVDKVLDRADGIPFILEQIALSIEAEGSENVNLSPQSVQSVIHARLNRLSASAKSSAQALSVLGEEVETDLAMRALGMDLETLQRDRSELEHLEIVHPSAGHSIRFRHAIVAEVCSETLPGARRQKIHRAAIDAIAAIHSDLGAQYERLAFHAEGARDDRRALEYLWLAAMRARRSSASGSLHLMFLRAMQCIERIGEPAESHFVDFLLMAFDPLHQIGEFRMANVYLPRALELAHKQNRRDKVCVALCHMSMVAWFEGRYEQGRGWSEQALEIANELGHMPLIFAAKITLANISHGMADMTRAIALTREMSETLSGKLETARLGASFIPGTMVRSYLCWYLMEVGRYEEGLAYVERALEVALREGEPYSEMIARIGMGGDLLKLKRNRDAVKCLEICMNLIKRNGYDAGLPACAGLLATALSRSGEAERAVRLVETWFAGGQEQRTGRAEMFQLNAGYAEALMRIGRTEEALAVADRAIEIGRSISNPCLMVQGLGLRMRLTTEAKPGSPQIQADRAEQRDLCRQFGLVA